MWSIWSPSCIKCMTEAERSLSLKRLVRPEICKGCVTYRRINYHQLFIWSIYLFKVTDQQRDIKINWNMILYLTGQFLYKIYIIFIKFRKIKIVIYIYKSYRIKPNTLHTFMVLLTWSFNRKCDEFTKRVLQSERQEMKKKTTTQNMHELLHIITQDSLCKRQKLSYRHMENWHSEINMKNYKTWGD